MAAELRARVVAVPRLRRRLASAGPGYAWVEDPGFDDLVWSARGPLSGGTFMVVRRIRAEMDTWLTAYVEGSAGS